MARRKCGGNVGGIPHSHEPESNVPEPYPEPIVEPEAPPGLDESETPIIPDSPRRTLSPGRFGNPTKDIMEEQPENSDSPTDDDPMEPGEERAARDAEFPDDQDLKGPAEE